MDQMSILLRLEELQQETLLAHGKRRKGKVRLSFQLHFHLGFLLLLKPWEPQRSILAAGLNEVTAAFSILPRKII